MSTNEIKVSVIIPVYNAENYLNQCLDSVISQSLKEIEIICVDDGSTDDSLKIIDAYIEKDNRVRILKQNHKYAGVARNTGMAQAKGKYLVFWDADDYFYTDALEKMYKQCEKDQADICLCGGNQFFQDIQLETPADRYLRKKELPEQVPFNIRTEPDHIVSLSTASVWNKMFRKAFIEKEQIFFKDTRNVNDVYFVVNAMCLAETVTLVNEKLICYRKNKNDGLVSSVSKGLLDAFKTWIETADSLREKGVFPERSFANLALESCVYLLNNTTDWDAFREGFTFLQDGNLEKLGIRYDVDDDYYYIGYQKEAARRLYQDTPEAYSRWIGRLMYLREEGANARLRGTRSKLKDCENKLKDSRNKIDELKTQLSETKQKLKDIRNSFSFKLGRFFTYLPRLLKKLIKGNRDVQY